MQKGRRAAIRRRCKNTQETLQSGSGAGLLFLWRPMRQGAVGIDFWNDTFGTWCYRLAGINGRINRH